MRSLFARVLTFIFIVVGAFAQTNNGTITGTISDPAGAVVPAAAVEVLRQPLTACTPAAMATSLPSAAPGPNRGRDKPCFG